jgi:glycosyltransferase involved in cell wall biosynthesis
MVSGAALVIQRLAEGLADRGHSVLVLSSSDQGHRYTEDYGELEIERFESLRNPLRVDQYFILWSYDHIYDALNRFQPDILHTHDPLNLGVAAIRAAHKYNIPPIFTIHQLPWFITTYLPITAQVKDYLENRIWQYSQWFMRQCDKLITPSQKIADIVQTNTGFLPHVISNGVDLDLFSSEIECPNEAKDLCRKYDLCPDHPVILYVGRIDPDKKVDMVIHASAKAMRETDAQLFVVGDGKQREELIRLCQYLGILQNCHFPGFISKHGDLPGIYRLANVFVTASEIEIQSSVVMEAAASGLPIITVQASSMSEFVIDGVSGYLVSPDDVNQMSERIVTLVKDQIKSRKMGQSGRMIAEAHSNQRFLEEHDELYEAVVHKPNTVSEKNLGIK